jgi:acyl-CoA thioesterase
MPNHSWDTQQSQKKIREKPYRIRRVESPRSGGLEMMEILNSKTQTLKVRQSANFEDNPKIQQPAFVYMSELRAMKLANFFG